MSVERGHAERIAALARLRFDSSELGRITDELNHILEHVEALRTLETSSPPERDEVEGDSTRGEGAEAPDELQVALGELAPDWRHGFFVVPPLPGTHDGGDE
jgi:aspartyl/glutamyl-tRNA(Asn/Gln) amidotransferase C subunit